ncbi:MAG TPA: ABC transporter permease [Chthoniobacter sp.]|nr:ABC transporter permease [Chthoniobacter sp.]
MITLVWKELRESVKWVALLSLLVLGAAELSALYPAFDSQADSNFSNGITLCRDTFLTVTTFLPPIVGLLLGFSQILPELERDRWAALLHRPIPRGRLFLGKAIAGVILYVVATVPPFLFCVWLAATPGHFVAPFVPGLALAGLADTGTGLVYYFAALLVALQRGGGRGLRVLPLLAAVHVTFYVVGASYFHDAAWAAGLMVLVLGLAGWGATCHREVFAARPWLSRLALLITAFYGLCGVADLVRYVSRAGQSFSTTGAYYEIAEDGRPLRLNYRQGVVVSVQELDGSTPTDPKYRPDRVRAHQCQLNTCSRYIGDPHGSRSYRWQGPYRASTTYLDAGSSFSHPQPEQWFGLVQERTFVGMSPKRKVAIARLDARGFQPPNAVTVPFSSDVTIRSTGHLGSYLSSPEGVRIVDLPRRTITNLTLPLPGPVYGTSTPWARTDTGSVNVLAVALAAGVAIYDSNDAHLLATLPYQREVDRWGWISVGINPTLDRFYLAYHPSTWIPRKEKRNVSSYLDEMNAEGKVVRSYEIPPLPEATRPPFWFDEFTRRLQSPVFYFGTLLYEKVGALRGDYLLGLDWKIRSEDNWNEAKKTAAYVILFSLLCAGVTLAWARRVHFSWPQALRWAGLALAFNIAGLIAFRLVADWPRLVPCAACRRPRPIDRQTCPHCAGDWPATTPTGTEIFDSVPTPETAATV